MSAGLDAQLVLAIVITLAALGGFVWLFVARLRQAALLTSESRTPRRWFLLGLAIALTYLYYTRRV